MRSLFSTRTIFLAAFAVVLPAIVSISATRTLNDQPNTCDEAVALGLLPNPPKREVTLCHFPGLDGKPFVIDRQRLGAADNHVGHHGDCVRFHEGTVTCNL
jgi:hypothetical protein